MARTFVALNDAVHGLLRNLTRRAPLCPGVARDGRPAVQYRVRAEELPAAYHSLALYHALEGWPMELALARRCRLPGDARRIIAERVGYFDAVRLDRRCGRDLRLKPAGGGAGLFAAELLAYGAGTLRAGNDNPAERLHRYLRLEHGRLESRHEVICARIVALNRHSRHWPGSAHKETYYSSNLIYGDAFGEVEQLWERRADTAFLDRVARSLQGLRRRGEIAAFLCPPVSLDGIMGLHLRAQALWRTPPTSARVLLRRLEYILEHTRVDDSPGTVFHWRQERARPGEGQREVSDWEPDDSGYDGWLPRGNNA